MPLIESGSPGFQSLTSFASPGSGRNQFIPDGGDAELVRNITNTRPVNGVSSADLSKVSVNSSGLGSAAGDWGTRTSRKAIAAHRRYMVRLCGVMGSGGPTDCNRSIRAARPSSLGSLVARMWPRSVTDVPEILGSEGEAWPVFMVLFPARTHLQCPASIIAKLPAGRRPRSAANAAVSANWNGGSFLRAPWPHAVLVSTCSYR